MKVEKKKKKKEEERTKNLDRIANKATEKLRQRPKSL